MLAQMLNCTEKQLEKSSFDFRKRHMFKGDSCYPLSPVKKSDKKSKNKKSREKVTEDSDESEETIIDSND